MPVYIPPHHQPGSTYLLNLPFSPVDLGTAPLKDRKKKKKKKERRMSSLIRLARPRTIACIGRNYADHIAELGNTRPSEPFYFLKPAASFLPPKAGPVLCPKDANLHFEVELAAVIGEPADELPATADALTKVKGWAVGVDMTARNRTSPPSPPACGCL
jgi:2-keto-4-pentenoate hydratase/2-oxohepta-3-ene-1,7-dioic acid hydratase in catechol pathway